MDPTELRWGDSDEMQKVIILNRSTVRQAIKIKCTDNKAYKVRPVYAAIEPGKTTSILVLRQNGINKTDKLVILAAKVSFLF